MFKNLINVAFFAILLAVVSNTVEAQAVGWSPFSSASGHFTVDVPVKPALTTAKDSTPVGQITEYTYTSDAANESFTVNYQDLPGLAVFFGGSGRIYSGARDGFLKDAAGTLVSFTKIKLNNHNGMQLLYNAPAAAGKPAQQGKVQMYLVGHRLYVVAASWPQGASSADADRFFSSFKINK